jgi:hypothetical protein
MKALSDGGDVTPELLSPQHTAAPLPSRTLRARLCVSSRGRQQQLHNSNNMRAQQQQQRNAFCGNQKDHH